jgi:adiponectin receptor
MLTEESVVRKRSSSIPSGGKSSIKKPSKKRCYSRSPDPLTRRQLIAQTLVNLPSDVGHAAHHLAEQAENLARNVIDVGYHLLHYHHLPDWMKDNDFLLFGHRPPMHNFKECFTSMFYLHTETINIWTHLIGFLAFVFLTVYSMTHPSLSSWEERAVYLAFFIGAMLCLGFSWVFHTVYCHSEHVSRLFNKLDYCGIALLTLGSFVPYIYYAFYCHFSYKLFYLALVFILTVACIVISTVNTFASPKFRSLRVAVFIGLGVSGVIPCTHYILIEGLWQAIYYAALGWLLLMGFLYIAGAVIYALRVPERIFPGKFDIWFQSHQIFHVLVVAGALVHFHAINVIAKYRTDFPEFSVCASSNLPVA